MSLWFLPTLVTVAVVLAVTGMFFFVTTRGALLVRAMLPGERRPEDHVYPIYSNLRLMRMVDFQPVIAAILLFQYDRLVSIITGALKRQALRDREVLITSCAFGNVMPRVVAAADAAGAARVRVVDIIENELLHAHGKIGDGGGLVSYARQDATALSLPDASIQANVLFFLLHELPDPLKQQALAEATRVLAPGGRLYLAEFHRPRPWLLRVLSWTYFKVFEPLGLALWDRQDPVVQLQAMGLRCERRTVFFGNFQVITATKPAG